MSDIKKIRHHLREARRALDQHRMMKEGWFSRRDDDWETRDRAAGSEMDRREFDASKSQHDDEWYEREKSQGRFRIPKIWGKLEGGGHNVTFHDGRNADIDNEIYRDHDGHYITDEPDDIARSQSGALAPYPGRWSRYD